MSEEFNVSVTVKIYLEDFSKVQEVKKKLSEHYKVVKTWEEEVGFGIKVLKASLLLQDNQGGSDALEEFLVDLPEVSQVQVEEVSRV